eukprot:s3135_g3.t1
MTSSGKHKSNCERDLRRVLEQSSTSLGVPLHDIPVRLWSHKDGNEYWGTLPVMWPDELAAAIYDRGQDIFTHCFAPIEPAAFWGHCEKCCSWFASHPARNINDKSKLIPFCFYGDEINALRNVENGSICVLGFGSDLASGNPALERYFLFTAFSEHNATSNTFDDIMRALLPRLRNMFSDQSNNCGGRKWTYSSTQGDLKFIKDRYMLHNFTKNSFCSLCACQKTNEDLSMTLADFRESASYRDTTRTHQDYMQATTAESRYPDQYW